MQKHNKKSCCKKCRESKKSPLCKNQMCGCHWQKARVKSEIR